jgi:nucleoside-diphosphate-sugar epimerase
MTTHTATRPQTILLTGATGYIGSAVLASLLAAGHTVTAITRSDAARAAVEASGATALQGDLRDVEWLTAQLREADAAVHAAAPGDATAEAFDAAVIDAVVAAFGGTDKRFVHTSGIWIYGDGERITETSPLRPPALVAWRPALEQRLLDSGVVASVVVPGIVYGNDTGISRILSDAPLSEAGALRLVGDGKQHWPTVHVDDLAALYVLLVESDRGHGRVLGVNEHTATVRELTEAVAAARGARGVEAESDDVTRARLGAAFADALLLDQRADAAAARGLGWLPTRPSLLRELAPVERDAVA